LAKEDAPIGGRVFLLRLELRKRPLAHQEDKSQARDHGYYDRKRETKLFHDAHGNAPKKNPATPISP